MATRVRFQATLALALGLGHGMLCGTAAAQSPTVLDTLDGGDGSRLGWSVSPAGDVDGDLTMDFVSGEPRDDTTANSAGRARVFSGTTGAVIWTVTGDSGADQLGYAVTGVGELTGDSMGEFAVGAPFDDNNGSASGMVRVYRGDTGTVLYEWDGDSMQDEFGRSVADAGDVNNDRVPDVIVGAPQTNNGGIGYARIFSGATGSVIRTITGVDPQSAFGISVDGVGDVDGDGFDDVIVGAYLDDSPGISRGRAYVFSGQTGGLIRFHDGLVDFDWFGWSVAGCGFVDGDARPDYIVGAYGADPGGDTSGQARVFSGVDGSVLRTLNGVTMNENLGWSVDGVGDVDGDGRDDLIVGAPVEGAGRARIYSGLNGALLTEIVGDDSGDQRGRAVAGVRADLNGDGYPDVLVGAPLDDDAFSSAGTLQVVSGYQPWTDLGGASIGLNGPPSLVGAGPLLAGEPASVTLTDAPPSTLLLAWIAFASAPFPVAGGVVHTLPFANQIFVASNPTGSFTGATVWPGAIPPGTEVWFQIIVQDPSVVWGFTMSNGVKATTP